jgi:hypothetical protein
VCIAPMTLFRETNMNPHRWRGLSEIARYPAKEVDVDDAGAGRRSKDRASTALAYLEVRLPEPFL